MNLLAHLHLSDGLPVGVAAGNLLADFMRRLRAEAPDADFAAGIRLHRAIDAFADADPMLRAVRAGFPPPWRRWGGILLDVAGDHFLARDWPRYSAVPLRAYVDTHLAEIRRHLQARAAPLGTLVERLRAEEWLTSYGTRAGLANAFERVARRSPRAAALRGAEREILRRHDELQAAFDEFYPRLRARFTPRPPQAACAAGTARPPAANRRS
ncbi:MAG TPA: ACP phosphodiesterase [Kiritimatiellia bacterium]|nr:ACP phosphodiesterase [Kiritimatiellia bacterium]